VIQALTLYGAAITDCHSGDGVGVLKLWRCILWEEQVRGQLALNSPNGFNGLNQLEVMVS